MLFLKMVHSPFISITNTLCPGADVIWRHHRLPLSTKSPTDLQNCTGEPFKRIASLTKNKNHSLGTTVLSLNDQAHTDSHWQTTNTSLTLRAASATTVFGVPVGTSREVHTVGGFSDHSAKFPCLWAIFATWRTSSPGRELHREKSLKPTTKLLFKTGETRCNSRNRKCLKTFNFKRTVHFLCHLKLTAAATTPVSNTHSTAPRKTIPSRRAVRSTACLWQPSDTGVPLPQISSH